MLFIHAYQFTALIILSDDVQCHPDLRNDGQDLNSINNVSFITVINNKNFHETLRRCFVSWCLYMQYT